MPRMLKLGNKVKPRSESSIWAEDEVSVSGVRRTLRHGRLDFALKDSRSLMSAGHPAELETLYGDYPLDHAFDEMREPGGDVR